MLSGNIQLKTLLDIGCTEELAEDQDTLEGNSFQKADYVHKTYKVDCFADDTGLEVEALNGEPGVYSARYAGPQRDANDNIELLLKNLDARSNRNARFRTMITLVKTVSTPKGTESAVHTFEGILTGKIISERRGAGGFGYDPVFVPDGHLKTLAEMTMQEKNAISHRAVAVRKLVNFLNTSR